VVFSGLLLTVGATWLLYLSGLFVLWTPLPLLYWYNRSSFKDFIVAALLSLLGLLVLYHFLIPKLEPGEGGRFLAVPGLGLYEHFGPNVVAAFAMIYFLSFVLMAGLLGRSGQRRDSINRTFLLAVVAPVIMAIALMGIVAAWHQMNLLTEIRTYLMALLEQIFELGGPEGVSQQQLVFLKEHQEAIATTIVEMMPAALVLGSLLTVCCNVIAARWWFPRRPLFKHLGPLSRWKLGDRWIWLLIAAGAVFFADRYVLEARPLAIVATNVLWILGAVYFLQGLAIVSFWLQKRRSLVLKGLVYGMVILFFQVMALILTVLAIFDIWFDFRKLSSEKS